jgi:flap endonuclease GEN
MPYLCNCSACPEKLTEFLEKKDEQKKQKRRARSKKSCPAAIKDVDAQLQELLLGIESESGTFPSKMAGPPTADIHTVAPLQDIVDLSSPSPPIRRASKIARSRKLSGSPAGPMDGIDLQSRSLLPGTMESQENTLLCDMQNVTWDKDPIDLSSPLPCAAHKPLTAQGMQLHMEEGRRALSDISNYPDNGSTLGTSWYKHEGRSRGSDALFSHGTGVENNAVAELATIDLSSPSPIISNKHKKNVDVVDICEAGGDRSPEHERKARELRSFLASIRDDLY